MSEEKSVESKRKYHRDWYKNSSEEFKERKRKKRTERHKINQQKVYDYLRNSCCKDCGEKDPVVLEFDHCRGEKINEIGNMVRTGTNIDKVFAEIAKCEIRCANCHRRKTARDFGWIKGS
jgi:hypothetical protein